MSQRAAFMFAEKDVPSAVIWTVRRWWIWGSVYEEGNLSVTHV